MSKVKNPSTKMDVDIKTALIQYPFLVDPALALRAQLKIGKTIRMFILRFGQRPFFPKKANRCPAGESGQFTLSHHRFIRTTRFKKRR
ncbi:hypothetical protein [Desulfosarcina alkanivorans]|uniref:hypothetical protein n=1 Tax=Desulfosarcina alkanivorans TaxID=571177 RepID=UPI0012D3339A|nr:hypothetical protein [Desulfosarcina alkanivorans]